MKLLKKLFGEIRLTWPLLILYSVVTGVVVGLLNCVPFLEGTSLVSPAVNFEYWFVAALFVITNSRKSTEAMAKTFVFFLISQPLIYLVEVPFKALGWGLFGYYKNWIVLTILTIPGAWVAYQVRRDKIYSPIILSVATGFLCMVGVSSFKNMLSKPPYGLLTVVFSLGFAVFFIQHLLKKNRNRIIAYVISIAAAAAFMFFNATSGSVMYVGTDLDPDHQWEVVAEESDTEAEISGSYLNSKIKRDGVYHIVVKNELGETCVYEVELQDRVVTIQKVENE